MAAGIVLITLSFMTGSACKCSQSLAVPVSLTAVLIEVVRWEDLFAFHMPYRFTTKNGGFLYGHHLSSCMSIICNVTNVATRICTELAIPLRSVKDLFLFPSRENFASGLPTHSFAWLSVCSSS